jgi:hypothetical protein
MAIPARRQLYTGPPAAFEPQPSTTERTMSQKLNFVGVPVYMNGQNYYVSSLSYPDFKANYDFLVSTPDLEDPKMFDYFDKLIPIVGLSLRRNYPDVTDEQLMSWLDMNTLPEAVRAVQGASGIKPVPEGE